MVELQILSKVINTKDSSILTSNGLRSEYFTEYKEEYLFIEKHLNEYKSVPDAETFLSVFPDFTLVNVSEPDDYLVSTLNEEHLYSITVPVVQKIADLLQTNSNDAVEYLHSQIDNLRVINNAKTNLYSDVDSRYEQYLKRCENPKFESISTGFKELDERLNGWHKGEELGVIFGRTGNGKTWVLLKSLVGAWNEGLNVGLIEPEMTAEHISYRIDTINGNFSNIALTQGKKLEGYKEYLQSLKEKTNKFHIAGLRDFKNKITVQKLRTFIINNDIDILGIDGISYMQEEVYNREVNRSMQLTNIAQGLMDLSVELGVPILVVAQSNRGGVRDGEAPGLENIRDSDGIAFNSSVVLAVKQENGIMEIKIQKNRKGITGGSVKYKCDLDIGKFDYTKEETRRPSEDTEPENAPTYADDTEVF